MWSGQNQIGSKPGGFKGNFNIIHMVIERKMLGCGSRKCDVVQSVKTLSLIHERHES